MNGLDLLLDESLRQAAAEYHEKSYRTSTKKSKRWISGPDAAASGKFGCPLGVFPAPAFVADFPPVAPEFHQRTHRIRLRNLGTTDKNLLTKSGTERYRENI